MAGKKKLKKQRNAQARLANEFHQELVKVATELGEVDRLLTTAEFPGPDIYGWAMQMQQFLQKLVEARGLGKACSLEPPWTVEMAASTSERSSPGSSIGEHQLLTEEELLQNLPLAVPQRQSTGQSQSTAKTGSSSPYAMVAAVENRRRIKDDPQA